MKFTTHTAKSARAIQHSLVCINNWQRAIITNIQSPLVSLSWMMITRHREHLIAERAFIHRYSK